MGPEYGREIARRTVAAAIALAAIGATAGAILTWWVLT